MAQHDYVIANGTGAAVRSDINNGLAAIVSNNSGATAPSTTYAYQWWADTTTGLLKLRNAANNGWITLFQLDGEWSTLAVENGTAAAPSIYFKDSGTDTGIYSPGTDQVAISTGGTVRLSLSTTAVSSALAIDHPLGAVGTPSITFTGDLNTGIYSPAADTLAFVEGGVEAMRIDSSGRVGIGSTSPQQQFVVSSGGAAGLEVDPSGVDSGPYFQGYNRSTSAFVPLTTLSSHIAFRTGSSPTERARIDSSGRLLVGTSSTSATSTAVFASRSDAAAAPLVAFHTTESTVTNGANFGTLSFGNTVATGTNAGAFIQAQRDGGTWTNNSSMPGRLVFSTTADGASSPTERMRINNLGALKATTTGSVITSTSSSHEFTNGNTSEEYGVRIRQSAATSNVYPLLVEISNQSPNNATSLFIQCSDSGATRLALRSNGGLANFSANNVNLSDRNVKKDITPAADTWDCLKEWEIVNFRYKDQADDADLNVGVIAQQVAENCPEVITVFQEAKEATEDQPAQEERIGVKEQQMMWMAIKALQEAQVRIETLEAEVAALKAS